MRELAQNGIITIGLKKRLRLPSKSLAQLARQLRMQPAVKYEVNGMPLTNAKQRIAVASIEQIEVTRSATGSTLSVWLFRQPNQPMPPALRYPPGTIMLRGMGPY